MAGRLSLTALALSCALALALALAGCDLVRANEDADANEDAPFAWPAGPNPVVVLEITSPAAVGGEITIELYPELAPQTVEQFLELARAGYYDGTTFHRVVPGFMVQGGDPKTRDDDPLNDGEGGNDVSVPDEFNAAPHIRGAVAMANLGRVDSAGSQFFIVHQDARDLDGHFTLFGRVLKGMEVVDRITETEIDLVGRWGKKNRPIEDVVIGQVVIENDRAPAPAPEAEKTDDPAPAEPAPATSPRAQTR